MVSIDDTAFIVTAEAAVLLVDDGGDHRATIGGLAAGGRVCLYGLGFRFL